MTDMFSSNSIGRNSTQKRVLKEKLVKKNGSRCKICGNSKRIEDLTIDHIVPLAKGGVWALWNLQLACEPCNSNKADRL